MELSRANLLPVKVQVKITNVPAVIDQCAVLPCEVGIKMMEKKLEKPKNRKPVSKRPGKVMPSKKDVETKKRFRKVDWEKEIKK